MFFRALFWGMLLGVLLTGMSAEDEPKEVQGILGESATFQLQSTRRFDIIFWKRNEMQLAILRRETPCSITLHETYEGRIVTASEDCSSLTVRDVREEDSAKYKAEFLKEDLLQVATQTFTLTVYKRLSEADLEVGCKEEIHEDGNKTWHLNCSAGKWGEGVGFSWISPGQKDKTSSSEISIAVLANTPFEDRNVTCKAKNPVSNATRTVSVKQACAAGKQPTTRPSTVADTETDSHKSPSQTILIPVIVVLVFLATIAAVVGWWQFKRNKEGNKELITPSSNSGPKDCKTIYAEIENKSPNVESGSPQQGRGSGAHKEKPITIYADVQHPEKIPLQTDDEKLRREKRRAAEKSEKTIYSEISDMKEANQENLKTIYDTVNLPKPQEASEYNKIL